MATEDRDYDYWESYMSGIPCGLYFYFINGANLDETAIMGNCGAIQSAQLVPFIQEEDLKCYKIQYDVDRFGDEEIYAQKFNILSSINIKRVENIETVKKELATFTVYNIDKDVGGDVHWKNESRLYNYPYSFAYITDHLNPPLEIKYHLCGNNNAKLMVKNSISDRCSYGLYVENYKGDSNGTMEALVSTDAHEIPVSSNAYANWVATNKNQISQNVRNLQQSTLLQNQGISQNAQYDRQMNGVSAITNGVGGIIGTITSIFNGGASLQGGISSIGNTLNASTRQNQIDFNSAHSQAINNQGVQAQISSYMAQASDMKSVPNTLISMGSDVYYGLINGDAKVYLYRMGLTNEMKIRLGDFFCMYGYKQNKVIDIKSIYRSRYYFNYIKTVGCNIKGDIPRKYMEEIKNIFNSGVTIWHMDRDGVEPLNWSKADNYEV